MKTMGVSDLRLVKPVHFPHPKAIWRATAANDIVRQARVYSSLPEAVADCQLVVATSARMRSLTWPSLSPRQLVGKLADCAPQAGAVALVFGREKSGLTNDELQLCQWHCVIPGNPDYSVLNLSHAVQVLCYELYTATCNQEQQPVYESDQPLATQQSIESMFDALRTMLDVSGFSHKDDSQKLMPRLRRFFARTQLDAMEANIWHGIFSKVVQQLQLTPKQGVPRALQSKVQQGSVPTSSPTSSPLDKSAS